MSTPKTIEVLTAIWERVLQRSPIGVADNFFDLGGDPSAANRLFAEIAKECGRELSPLTIYQAPTIAALATVLEDPALPKLDALVLLKSGSTMPPIFMVPGLCSSVMEFFKLVKHLDSGHPIFGMQPRGLDGVQDPFERVEDLAKFYVEAIRGVQPRGPYILLGYSFGGVQALEMAQQLSAVGETIALLAMVEAYPFRKYAPFGQRTGIFMRRLMNLVPKKLRHYGLWPQLSEDPQGVKPDLPVVGEAFTPVMRRVCVDGFRAFERYRPKYCKGRISFVKAAKRTAHLPRDPIAVWAKLADELVTKTAPGGHWGIITSHAESLAAVLLDYLKDLPEQI